MAQEINGDRALPNLLRKTGRRFQAGQPIDIEALSQLIEARRKQRPMMCATLTDLIQATEDDTARGDRDAALKHLRAAIDLTSEPAKD